MSDQAFSPQSSSSWHLKKASHELNESTVATLAFSLILPLFLSFILELFFDSRIWKNEALYTGLETLTGSVSLILAPLILLQTVYERERTYLACLGSGLVCMGVLNLVSVFDPSFNGLLWNRSFSHFFGGLLFASVWWSPKLSHIENEKPFLWTISIVTALFALACTFLDDYFVYYFKQSVTEEIYWALNVIGAFGFLASATYFLSRERSHEQSQHLVFANYILLLCSSTLVFEFATQWSANWWYFFLLRSSSHLILLYYVLSTFQKYLNQNQLNQAFLHSEVSERTRKLSETNDCLRSEIKVRMKAEKDLRNSQGQLEATLHAIHDWLVVFNSKAQVVFANQSLEETGPSVRLGDSPEYIARYFDLYQMGPAGETYLPTSQWPVSRVLKRETLTDVEIRLHVKETGMDRYFLVSGEPFLGADGQEIFAIMISKDITQLKEAERDVKENESRLQEFADSMPQIVWATDNEGRVEFFNRRWTEFTGFEIVLGSFKTDVWRAIMHPDDYQTGIELWRHSLKTGDPFQFEYRMKSGQSTEYRWHLGRAVPIYSSGQLRRWIGTCTDMHDQKTLMDQISQSEERLSLATRAAEIATWEWDLKTDAGKVSSTYNRMFDLPESPHFHISRAFARILPEDRQCVEDKIRDAISMHREFFTEFRVEHDNGNIHWLMGRGRVIYNEAGEAIRMFGVNMDITDRKVMEEKLRLAAKQAQEANELKSAFLANMSHEIRTPLGVILGFTELLQDPNLTTEEKENIFNIIQRNGKQLSNLISDILDLSKVEAGQFSVENLILNFRDLVSDVVSNLDPKSRSQGLELKINISDEVPDYISTDPTRLRQILSNIIGNAVKFTEKGSVEVRALMQDKKNLKIQVIDTGIGLSPAQIERLFQPFTQADESTTRKFGGTGLGLVLSRKLARALNGDLVIEQSSPGVGSTFALTIPNRIADVELTGLKILVADDLPENREWLSRVLTKHHALVKTAVNGKKALEEIQHENFDLVLMDLKMPEMDGLTATEKIRALGFQNPIIVVTAADPLSIRNQCLKVGCTDQISTPVEADQLMQVIARHAHVA